MQDFTNSRTEILELALGQIQDLVIFTDTDFASAHGPRIVFVNKAVERLTGYSADELIGRSPKMLQGPLTDRHALDRIRQSLERGETIQEELVNYSKDGEPYWLEMIISPVVNKQGKLTNFISIQRDITARKNDELKLAKLEADYRFMFENVQAGVILHRANTEIVYANPMALELLGANAETIAGTPNSEWSFINRDGLPMPVSEYPVNRVVNERKVIHGMLFGNRRASDGKLVWALCSAFPIIDESGEVTEVLTSFTDITKIIEAETEANAFRQRFELASAATQDAIFEWNLETNEFWANDAYEVIYGYRPPSHIRLDALGEMTDLKADHVMVRKATLEAIESKDNRYSLDYQFTRPDGTLGHAVVRGFIVRDNQGKALRIIGTSTDIGKLTEMASALAESKARFKIIANRVSDVLWDFNYETNDSWVTPDWPQKLGLEVSPTDKKIPYWYDYVDPPDLERLVNSQREALASEEDSWEIEYKLIGADGKKIDVAVSAAILRHADGKAYRMLGNVRNITAEKRRLEGFTRSRALEAVGQLTGGVAHDFNNQLMIIQGNAELLEMGELDEEQKDSVALINQASHSAAQLTRRLLSFSGQSHLSSGRVKLSELIPNAVLLLQSGLPEFISIHQEIPADSWDVAADANALEQAIVNLAVNARDAMPKGGDITICCENRQVADDMHQFASKLEPGDYVVVSVVDNGEGMSAEVLSKVFEPFFTTKDVDKGTGLGLSTVYGFAKQSGGSVTIYSEPGKGTTVNIYLPRFKGEAEDDHAEEQSEGNSRRPVQSRILLVEDHPQVRAHVEKLLKKLDYAVTAVANANEALALMYRAQEFELLFTDVVMPGGMNGQELAEEVRKVDPRIKVLFTSGYPAFAFEHLGLAEQESINLLRKPYKAADLKKAIADALGE